MNNSSKVKAEFLGMPYGTASNRLRKMLMFKFAQELGYDECFACGEKIETAEDLSIEHKEPWLNRDVDKFWDLDNIAFSHLKCNVRSFDNDSRKKIGPEGTAWCSAHQQFEPTENFYTQPSRWNGLDQMCKEQNKERRNSRR